MSLEVLSNLPKELQTHILQFIGDWKLCVNLEAILSGLPCRFDDVEMAFASVNVAGIFEASIHIIKRLIIHTVSNHDLLGLSPLQVAFLIWCSSQSLLQVNVKHVNATWKSIHPTHVLQLDTVSSIPATIATLNPRLQILRCIHAKNTSLLNSSDVVHSAAFQGNLDSVMFLDSIGSRGFRVGTMAEAARNGHLHIIQWLHTNRSEGCNKWAMDNAVENGHLHVVEWLHANRTEGCNQAIVDSAAQKGHLDVVKWFHENKGGITERTMDLAAANGHLELVKWMHCDGIELCTEHTMNHAAANGQLHVVEWLHEYTEEYCCDMAIDFAARNGHQEVVTWLKENWSRLL
ncbi:hypothetical protein HDU97_006871 [Phlyctochytrium planicorne]|nr:hypothetical protein HDU97_006871 [Phlyctochytrium planicorne]